MKALIILAILLLSPVALGQERVATKIHTPGFYASPEELDKLLRQLAALARGGDPSLARALERVASCDTIECIMSDPLSASVISGAVESSAQLDINSIFAHDVEELLKNIEDPAIRQALEEAMASGKLSDADVSRLLDIIGESARQGRINERGLFLALEALKRLSETATSNSLISKAQSDVIKRILSESDLARRIITSASQSGGPSLNVKPVGFSGVGLPATLPEVSLSLPPTEHIILLLFAIAAPAALYLLTTRTKVARAIDLVVSRGRFAEERQAKGVIGIYWEAVRLVEAVTKMRKVDSQTHREYYSSVSSHEAIREPFGKITHGYELVRYGGLKSEELAAELVRDLEKIRRL